MPKYLLAYQVTSERSLGHANFRLQRVLLHDTAKIESVSPFLNSVLAHVISSHSQVVSVSTNRILHLDRYTRYLFSCNLQETSAGAPIGATLADLGAGGFVPPLCRKTLEIRSKTPCLTSCQHSTLGKPSLEIKRDHVLVV